MNLITNLNLNFNKVLTFEKKTDRTIKLALSAMPLMGKCYWTMIKISTEHSKRPVNTHSLLLIIKQCSSKYLEYSKPYLLTADTAVTVQSEHTFFQLKSIIFQDTIKLICSLSCPTMRPNSHSDKQTRHRVVIQQKPLSQDTEAARRKEKERLEKADLAVIFQSN